MKESEENWEREKIERERQTREGKLPPRLQRRAEKALTTTIIGGKNFSTRYRKRRKNANDEYTQHHIHKLKSKLLRKLVCKWRFESKRNGMEKDTKRREHKKQLRVLSE
jgi:hypothetical protein